ncbi:hypothetical protein [Maribellus mangrovi]|uniref:hypothetical protein n=1 Tax=Maribellus mangrovi TaxID=3133146 RepID=UPI0030EF5498
MKINNKTSPFLTGPYIFFGLIFVITGILCLIASQWVLASFNLFIAWYLFATFSGAEIDTETRKFRSYNKHFGLIKTGRWRKLDDYLGVTLVPMKKVYTMYSRSNRVNTSDKMEYRIYLVNKAKRPGIEIKTCKTPEMGQQSLDEFSIWLKMPVFSVPHR